MKIKGTRAVALLRRSSFITIAWLTTGAQAAIAQAPDSPQSPPIPTASSEQVAAETVAEPVPQDAAASQTDIVVSGTRVVRDGYSAPTPTTVVGEALLVQRAPSTIVDALATLPAFKGSGTTGTAGATVNANGGQGFANLRGLGANRTLVLINGQRVVPSTEIGTVDINLLPSGIIQRADVVTGGASASYGSDAVAGVLNFVLATKFEGIKGELSAGVASRGDAGNQKATLTAGRAFLDDRLHVVASGDYFRSDGLEPLSRPWALDGYGLIANPGFTATNGQPQRLILPFIYYGSATNNGLINAGPLRGTEFLGNGQTRAFQFCDYVSASAMACPTARPELSKVEDSAYLSTPLERISAYGRATYDVSDDLSVFVDYLYGRSSTAFQSAPPNTVFNGNFTIQRDNAFLPGSVRARMVELGLNNFSFGRNGEDIGSAFVNRRNEVNRVVAGLEGKVGDFKFNLHGQHGVTKNQIRVSTNAILGNLRNAIDAVVSPTTGQIVCRSTLTAPANGCIPLNLFGQNQFNPAARSYIFGQSEALLRIEQNTAAFDVSGEPFSTWAGPVSLVLGAEYREEKARQTVTALDQASAFAIGNFKALDGKVRVKEVFGELVVPLLRDVAFTKSLDLNAAGRITNYSSSGTVKTWKLGFTWEPVDGLRVRGTRSRDIRAANILELFSDTVQTSATIADPQTNQTVSFQTVSVGNPNLTPEIADTYAIGAVVQPSFLPGFSASVDYYDITIKDSIQTNTPLDIVTRCFTGNTSFCPLVQRNAANVITLVTRPFLNLSRVKNSGVDIEASYRTSLDGVFGGESSSLTLRALGNYTIHSILDDGLVPVDRAGSLIDAVPKWTWDFGVILDLGGTRAAVDVTYLGGGKYDNRFVTEQQLVGNKVASATFVNLNLEHTVLDEGDRRLTGFININNLFDRAPPNIFSVRLGPNYDRIGRAYKAGVRFAF